MKLKIDRTDWKKVKLGDVAFEYSKRINNPSESEFDRFVGSSNIGQWDFRVLSWESTDSVSSAMKLFEPNDYLLVRRSLYASDFRERAPRAHFNGVCSGDILTIKENPKFISDGFLIGVLNSPKLWKYVVANASGSITRRIKWKDLANYEFLLPPKDQQKELAELLWAMDRVIEKEREVLERLNKYKNALFHSSIYKLATKNDKYFGRKISVYPVVKLGDLLMQIQYGISESLQDKGVVPILRMNNLQDGKLTVNDLKFYNPKDVELDKFILDKGDVLFNRTNSYDLVGKVSLFDKQGVYSFASYLIRLKVDETKLDSRFLNFYLNTPIGTAKIRKYRTPGVSQSNINAQNLKHVHIPLADLDIQRELMNKIESIELNEELSQSKIASSQALQKSLINEIF
jgi:restriction endonuclease S subunit